MKKMYIAPEAELLRLAAQERLTNDEVDFDDLIAGSKTPVSEDPNIDIDVVIRDASDLGSTVAALARIGYVHEGELAEGGVAIKSVKTVLTDKYQLSEEMLKLCFFMKEYTLCTFGEAVRCILPPGALSDVPNVKERRVCTLKLGREAAATLLLATGRSGIKSEGQRDIIRFLMDKGSADAELIKKSII